MNLIHIFLSILLFVFNLSTYAAIHEINAKDSSRNKNTFKLTKKGYSTEYLPLSGGTINGTVSLISNNPFPLSIEKNNGGYFLKLIENTSNAFHSGIDNGGVFMEAAGNLPLKKRIRIQVGSADGGGGDYTQLFIDGANQNIYTSNNTRFGIGTPNPAVKFHVETNADGPAIRVSKSTNDYWYSGFDADGAYIELKGSSAEREKIRIQSSTDGSVYTQLYIDGV